MKRGAFLTALLAGVAVPAYAAEIKVDIKKTPPVVTIEGIIDEKDFNEFLVKTQNFSGARVKLRSTGGAVTTAMNIGRRIRSQGFSTEVVEYCNSACGLIWLAGQERYLPSTVKVGFHQPKMPDGSVSITTVALIGAYLGQLGLSTPAIIFTVSAAPSEMRWLSKDDALALGIIINEGKTTTSPYAYARAVPDPPRSDPTPDLLPFWVRPREEPFTFTIPK